VIIIFLLGETGVDRSLVVVGALLDSLLLLFADSKFGPEVAPEPRVLGTTLAEQQMLFFVGGVLLDLPEGASALALSSLELRLGLTFRSFVGDLLRTQTAHELRTALVEFQRGLTVTKSTARKSSLGMGEFTLIKSISQYISALPSSRFTEQVFGHSPGMLSVGAGSASPVLLVRG
jgi:hypothetical protein